MTKVKICGIKNEDDLNIINKHKPDYAGFVLAESKRQISLEQLEKLIKNLDPEIVPVGVFVNQQTDFVMEAAKKGIKIIQLHGDEDGSYIGKLKAQLKDNIGIWKVIRIGAANADFTEIKDFEADGFLLDTYSHDFYGGTGKTFDWKKAEILRIDRPVIVAGGLNPENVIKAIETARPYCVDVSSGVEESGNKNDEKVRKFIEKVRNVP